MKPFALCLAPTVLILSACSEEAAVEENGASAQSGDASGEVLGGTISDDMLSLEQLRSQSPSAQDDPNGAANSSSSIGGSATPVNSASSPSSSESSPESSNADAEASQPASEPADDPAPAGPPEPAPPPPADAAPSVAPPVDNRK